MKVDRMFDTMTNKTAMDKLICRINSIGNGQQFLCNYRAPRRFTGLYMPLTNLAFDRTFYLKLRGRSGTQLMIGSGYAKRNGREYKNEEILWGFIADQNPSDPKRVSWNDFMNRKTAFFKGLGICC